jgi:arsenate reductase
LAVADLRSKSWDEFARPEAPPMDFIFTVCDNAAGEACPVWPGHPATAHWGFADPAAVVGTDEQKRAAFEKTYAEITARIRLFLALPLEQLDRMSLHSELTAIGNSRA